eukprot:GHUV01042913.1.p1 GENE.GHUV01042913.1~~GHUV01042913.1.p1  ORF type:complete len:162 (-),score=40.87 GHUV01042913.1:11-496(-)
MPSKYHVTSCPPAQPELLLQTTSNEVNKAYSMCAVQDGDRFWRMPEVYIRGNTLKYLRVPEEVKNTGLAARHNTAVVFSVRTSACCPASNMPLWTASQYSVGSKVSVSSGHTRHELCVWATLDSPAADRTAAAQQQKCVQHYAILPGCSTSQLSVGTIILQ